MLWRWRTSKRGRRASQEKTADGNTKTTALEKGKGKGKGFRRVVPEVRISQVDGEAGAVFGSMLGEWGGFDVGFELGDPSEWYHEGRPIIGEGEGEVEGGEEGGNEGEDGDEDKNEDDGREATSPK